MLPINLCIGLYAGVCLAISPNVTTGTPYSGSTAVISHNLEMVPSIEQKLSVDDFTASAAVPSETKELIGTFRLTYYDTCPKCTGKWSGENRTATGTIPTQGRTVAIDPSIVPLGSKVLINDHEYVCEDTGNFPSDRVDMFFNTHSAGRAYMDEYGEYAEVYLIND